jgi:recombination protein RecT
MYQGLLRRFRRSGQFKWITANVVHEGDFFEHWIDEAGEHFKHVPGGNFMAPITRIYSLATTKDGGVFVAVLPIAEANKIRNQSRATREDSPWKQWPEEMYKKTALRRLSKYLPSARDLLPDEEPPEIDAPATALQLPPLEAASPTVSYSTAVEEQGGAQDQTVADQTTAAQSSSSAQSQSDSAAVPDSSQELMSTAIAYQRGVKAKDAGHRRTALPGEYRGITHKKQADAWFAGYDGADLPHEDDNTLV